MKVATTPPAERSIDKLDPKTRTEVLLAIKSLENFPQVTDVKKMTEGKNLWRKEAGKLRIIFEINKKEQSIYVLRIKPRKDVFRKLNRL